jgi:putative addiction module component (TIGR02574 family)
MTLAVEVLESEALGLPLAERARLAERLIASLDTEAEVDAAWAAEVERRHADIERGAVKMLSGAKTLARLKAGFQ